MALAPHYTVAESLKEYFVPDVAFLALTLGAFALFVLCAEFLRKI